MLAGKFQQGLFIYIYIIYIYYIYIYLWTLPKKGLEGDSQERPMSIGMALNRVNMYGDVRGEVLDQQIGSGCQKKPMKISCILDLVLSQHWTTRYGAASKD